MHKNTPTEAEVRIPKNFDADLVLNQSQHSKHLRSDAKAALKDSMHFILNSVIEVSETRKGRDMLEEDGVVPINSDILNEKCGKRYTLALKILEESGVIYRTNSYSVGNYSKGICLVGEYASAEESIVRLSFKDIKEKVLKYQIEQDRENEQELAKIEYITKWFNDEFEINLEEVHKFNEFYQKKLKDAHTQSGSSIDITNRINTRYNSSLASASKITIKEFRLTKKGEDNRLHSTVSSMKKELRSFLTHNKEPLVGVDVKSSQPYLLTQLLKPEFYEEDENGLNISNLYPELYKLIPKEEISSILMSGGYKHSFDDIKWEDDFYSSLINIDKKEHKSLNQVFKTRGEVKRKVIVSLYNKKYKADETKAFKRFEELFPKEAKIVKLFHKIGGKDKNYLPILMQRLESKLILEIVCKEVSEKIPNAPIIPVHDSILTTPEYQMQVRDIMEDTLLKVTGVKPGLKLENETSEDRLKELESIAKEDLQEIYKKNTQSNQPVSLKKPSLSKFPELDGKKILSTRYLENNQD